MIDTTSTTVAKYTIHYTLGNKKSLYTWQQKIIIHLHQDCTTCKLHAALYRGAHILYYIHVCVCVCVFSSHSFWTSSSLDVPAGVTQEEGHTGFFIHLLSAVRALIFLARKI